jgi:hypothetical protein
MNGDEAAEMWSQFTKHAWNLGLSQNGDASLQVYGHLKTWKIRVETMRWNGITNQ